MTSGNSDLERLRIDRSKAPQRGRRGGANPWASRLLLAGLAAAVLGALALFWRPLMSRVDRLRLLEALLLGLIGGLLGCLLVLPLHGLDTGTTNFQTFSEVAFAFRVTPPVLVASVIFATALGVVPARSAARKRPTEALGRR